MNWSHIVWGTCLIDYSGYENAALRAFLLDRASHTFELMYGRLGWDTRICLPLCENPINAASFGLEFAELSELVRLFRW
jgi:hypothetical protein